MTTTLTKADMDKIRDFLKNRHIPSGLGDKENACSIASINLALDGRLTDDIPECMSPVIGRWIIVVQDVMPDDMRNSEEWRKLLPLAAGTGRQHEGERSQILLDWMWETVLPYLQDLADKQGFGSAWETMTTEKTATYAARAAADAATYAATYVAYADTAAYAAYAAAADATDVAARAAADAATYAADAATYAADADAADAATYAAARAAYADAADAATYAARAAAAADAARAKVWSVFNPVAVLKQLVEVK